MATAIFLPFIGDRIAEETGLAESFVGSVFIAIATTLPELTVSYTTYRIGTVDMAVGNLFGSNLFNVNILAFDDLFYTQGPLLSNVSGHHVVSVIGTMAMTAVAIIALTLRSAKKRFLLSWGCHDHRHPLCSDRFSAVSKSLIDAGLCKFALIGGDEY